MAIAAIFLKKYKTGQTALLKVHLGHRSKQTFT